MTEDSPARAAAIAGHPKVGGDWSRAIDQVAVLAVAAAVTVYLGLSGGGYDIVVRSELGLVIWWLVILGALVGLLPRARVPRAGWIAASLLGGFLLWTWIGLAWSKSHELTLDSVCLVSTYLGTLVLGLCVVTPRTAQPLLAGLASGITIVTALALLSKLTPGMFPANPGSAFYADTRLSYPFDYADGVGEFAALGLPLLLFFATGARQIWARALAAAGLPLVLLCLAMTVSRGGILAAAIGIVAFFALAPNRLPRLATLVLAAGGIGVLMLALLHRTALRDDFTAPASERHSMLVILIVVVLVTMVLQTLLVFAERRGTRPAWTEFSPAGARRTALAIIVVVAVAVVAAFASGQAADAWRSFKEVNPTIHTNQYFRLFSLGGSHRYQYWQVALKAFESAPLIGIGPGMFRFYWAQHQTIGEYIQNAHSLWFETLAETGVIGYLLIAGFFVWLVVGGARRVLRRTAGSFSLTQAAAVSGVAAFCGAASFDWDWQIGVIPMVTMLMAAVAVADLGDQPEPSAAAARWPQTFPMRLLTARPIFATLGILGAVLIAIPLASTVAVRRSQQEANRGNYAAALRSADAAAAIEPGAASPREQQAELLEKLDQPKAATVAIRAALAREPENSELWLTASRLAAERDDPAAAVADYNRAKQLDPTNTIFGG